jgi:hypothetical protein
MSNPALDLAPFGRWTLRDSVPPVTSTLAINTGEEHESENCPKNYQWNILALDVVECGNDASY